MNLSKGLIFFCKKIFFKIKMLEGSSVEELKTI